MAEDIVGGGFLLSAYPMDAHATSKEINVESKRVVAFQCWTTGGTTHTGTLSFQGSNDRTHWTEVGSQAVSSGSALNHMESVVDKGCKWYRVVFTRTAGVEAELLSILAHAKD